jgi:hypothetical protein
VINEIVINEIVINEDAINEDAINEIVINEIVINEDAINEDAINEPESDAYNLGLDHEISLPYVSIIRKEYHRIYHNYPNKFRYVKYMDKAIQEIKDVCDANRYKKWDKNNEYIDMKMYERKHSRRMSYILTYIEDLYAKPIGS